MAYAMIIVYQQSANGGHQKHYLKGRKLPGVKIWKQWPVSAQATREGHGG